MMMMDTSTIKPRRMMEKSIQMKVSRLRRET